MTIKQELKFEDMLKNKGWEQKRVHLRDGSTYLTDTWISPYTGSEYNFEQALRIEDLI